MYTSILETTSKGACMESTGTPTSVSYTHLLNREMIRHAGHMVANRPDQALLISDQLHLVRKPLGIVHKEIEPVSYTHLDVYKRQG